MRRHSHTFIIEIHLIPKREFNRSPFSIQSWKNKFNRITMSNTTMKLSCHHIPPLFHLPQNTLIFTLMINQTILRIITIILLVSFLTHYPNPLPLVKSCQPFICNTLWKSWKPYASLSIKSFAHVLLVVSGLRNFCKFITAAVSSADFPDTTTTIFLSLFDYTFLL